MRAWLCVALAATIAGCGGGEDPVRLPGLPDPLEARVGEPFVLAVGGEARVDDGRLTLELLRVAEDSRCPVDVTCVWAGNAALELRASVEGMTEAIRLETHEAREVPVGPYLVALDSLAPEPREGGMIDQREYRATITVERAPR